MLKYSQKSTEQVCISFTNTTVTSGLIYSIHQPAVDHVHVCSNDVNKY